MEHAEIMLRNKIAEEYSQSCKARRFWSTLTRRSLTASSILFILSVLAAVYASH